MPILSNMAKQTLFFLLALAILTIYTTLHSRHSAAPPRTHRNTLLIHDTFLSSASNYTIAAHLRHLTHQPHLAGTPPSLSTALYVKSYLDSLHIPTHISNFSVLLSYPTHSSLSVHLSTTNRSTAFHLSEPGVPQNGVVIPYHAYSPSGSAYGKPVFLNHGTEADYNALGALDVEVKGCIGIVRRGGGMSRYEVVSQAAKRGLIAVLMYTKGDNSVYDKGVERGTVMDGVGDPLSPGWGAVQGGERLQLDDPRVTERFPGIPSLPISVEVANSILKSLEGVRVPQEWKSSGVQRAGPGPLFLNFTYEGEKKLATIQNVFALIRGSEEPDRFVLLGNHRDAWTYGAVDPNSGTAALLDIARRFSLLMRKGWNPRRSIVLCSWDAEEFGMIGSTEWAEQNLVNLGSKAVAYLNVDCAVQGPGFFAGATPQLDDLLLEVTKKVNDPDLEYSALYDRWRATNEGIKIQRLSGVDSDFAPFLQHMGIPSVDLYYGADFPVYHTAFDSYNWISHFGDPYFLRHVAVTGVWGLLALHLADEPILPFNYLSYAAQLQEYTSTLSKLCEESISWHPISSAIKELTDAAKEIREEAKKLKECQIIDESLVLKTRILNDRLMSAERGFLDAEGLRGRQWFKHQVYGPHGVGSKSKLYFFPGIVNAIYGVTKNEKERQAAIQHEIWRVARAIQRAAYALKDDLLT